MTGRSNKYILPLLQMQVAYVIHLWSAATKSPKGNNVVPRSDGRISNQTLTPNQWQIEKADGTGNSLFCDMLKYTLCLETWCQTFCNNFIIFKTG